ncbi:MAG TPA: nitroreductase family protein [Spirochaetota bacterium]|nr:nitroreductase family protein [Spirochaetota bacterium]
MKRTPVMMIITVIVALYQVSAGAQTSADVALKKPSIAGMNLIEALAARSSVRAFNEKPLSNDDLGAILWAANGVNRPGGKRTAPAAYGRQYIKLYVVSDEGAWLYDAEAHRLAAIANAGRKKDVATQGYVTRAPHILVIVADLGRFPLFVTGRDDRIRVAHSTAGCVAQNVYLMAAALKAGTCMVAGVDEKGARRALSLTKDELPLYVMPLGYPAK